MFIFRQSRQVHAYIEYLKSKEISVGFVPTMGALHDGHGSLIELSKNKGDFTVCSIFVNPTQFDNKEDLQKYPRTEVEDLKILESLDCDLVFIPSVQEVYPEEYQEKEIKIEPEHIIHALEGSFRTGHFEGMMQVVSRLLEIIPADRIYMGQKDFQQQMIVKKMMTALDLATKLVMAPIKRENDGLAMSSRNRRINQELRPNATALFKALTMAKEQLNQSEIEKIILQAKEIISSSGFNLEYFEIVDGSTLFPIRNHEASQEIVALTAGWLGEVRLIDNMILKP